MNLKTKLVCGWTNLNEEGKMQAEIIITGDGIAHQEVGRLIEAAPELLAACEAIATIDNIDTDEPMGGADTVDALCSIWPKVKAAIHKVRGEGAKRMEAYKKIITEFEIDTEDEEELADYLSGKSELHRFCVINGQALYAYPRSDTLEDAKKWALENDDDTFSLLIVDLDTGQRFAPRLDLQWLGEEPKQIVIHVEGGLVQSVISDEPLGFTIIDYDTEGADADEIADIPQPDLTTDKAYFSVQSAEPKPERLSQILKAVKEKAPKALDGNLEK